LNNTYLHIELLKTHANKIRRIRVHADALMGLIEDSEDKSLSDEQKITQENYRDIIYEWTRIGKLEIFNKVRLEELQEESRRELEIQMKRFESIKRILQ
jgi:hypothetical protein